jgi:long-chain acyl-CoA synthetase
MLDFPHASQFDSLLALLEDAATRWPTDAAAFSLRTDDGVVMTWSAAELRRRSLLAAWRLRASGLAEGDRLLTWSPSTPRLPAVYFGAMRAGVVIVPLDLRMTPAVIERISGRAETDRLAIDDGYDAPDPAEAGLDHLSVMTLADLTEEPDDSFPADWQSQVEGWRMPDRESLFEVVFTSGTTADPKGVLLTHGNILETIAVFGGMLEEGHQRVVSILPLSHLFEQAPILFYGASIGAEVVYVRSRNPRVIFGALRETRVTAMVLTPQILELFWNSLTREVEKQGKTATFERARKIARHLPYAARRVLFRKLHAQLGGELKLMVTSGAYLPPDLQRAWEDVGVIIMQGYGSTETGIVSANDQWRHPAGIVGRVRDPIKLMLAPDTSEILVKSPTITSGYWRDEEATAAARNADGWWKTGDTGRFNDDGELILSGRVRNIIVLPNGFNVYPEDIEAALTDHGLNQTVVLEAAPGRIEAVVLPPGAQAIIRADAAAPPVRSNDEEAALKTQIDAIVKAANADLAVHQRVVAWRLWPDPDFPRTHTLKIKRNDVREWAGSDIALKVSEAEEEG